MVAQLATQQFGVVSLEQLRAIGLSYRQIRGRVKRGWLLPLYRGVFAVGHRRIVPHGRLFAALLAVRPDPFLCHRTAAAVGGLREISVRRIELTVVSTGGRPRAGLTVHRIKHPPDPADVTVRHGLRVSSVPRMLIELAARERPTELDRLITQSIHQQIFDLGAMERALHRHAHRPGVGRLKAALAGYLPRPDRKSDLERAFDRLLLAHPDIPPPLRNVQLGPWEIDCLWPKPGLALELDGRPYHVAVRDTEKDRIKDAKLMRLGLKPLRVTDLRFRLDQRGVLDDLRALLGLTPPRG
jgi:hypothetical protein